MKTEVCLYSRHVTQELTLWLVGSIGGNADPPADIQPDDSLGVVFPTPLLTTNEIEHEATNGTGSPEPQPPSLPKRASPSLPSRGEPTTLSHSRKVQPGDVGDIHAGRLPYLSSAPLSYIVPVPPIPKQPYIGSTTNHQPLVPDYPSILPRGRSTTKKALLIGIAYGAGIGRRGQRLDYIPTSVPNVRAFETFLRGRHSLSLSVLSHLHNTSTSYRVSRIHRHHCHDRRGGSRRKVSANKEQSSSQLPATSSYIHSS